MSAPTETKAKGDRGQKTCIYLYGILPGDAELTSEVRGVGRPSGKVRLVRSDDLATLVSEVDVSKPLGTPEDYQAHEEIVDSTATGSPVLPIRFGAVLTNEDAVVDELLKPHRDEFAKALQELEGRIQYVVRGRYVERVIMTEILSENREAAKLREQIRGTDPDATRDLRIRLGEIINNAVKAKRQADTRRLLSGMADHSVSSSVREPTHELDAAYVAFLVDTSEADELRQAVRDLSNDWQGRVELRARGPMAPWDFVDGSKKAQG